MRDKAKFGSPDADSAVPPAPTFAMEIPQRDNGLFSVPEYWKLVTLGEVCKQGGGNIQTGPFGSQLHASDYVPVGIPSIMPQNIGDNRISEDGIARIAEREAERLSRYLVRAGDIVYSRRGDVERRALIREHEEGWLCGTGCLRVRFGKGVVHPPFAAFYLGHPLVREWIVRHAHGATMPNLNTSILSALPFVLPPLDEQRAIAHILGTLDDKIELNRRMNATLEATARAIFKSWFVDFDPVRAKAAGRVPVGMTPEVAALFPEGFEDSALGEIPRGWREKPLPDVVEVNPPCLLRKGQMAPYLDMANVPTDTARAGQVIERAFSSGSRFQNGDTLLARITPCLENGKTAIVDFLDSGQVGWGSTEFIVLRPRSPLPQEFAYFLAREEIFRSFAIANMSGTSGRQRVPANCFNGYLLALPPPEITAEFGTFAASTIRKIRANDEQSRTLATLRDTLLPKLLSGELRVNDLESKA